MYAIIETGNKQYRVEKDTVLAIEKLDAEKGGKVTFDHVLMTSNDGQVKIGKPTVPGACVQAEVVEHFKADKVTTYKKRRRHGFERTHGHRQPLTKVKITGIQAS
ncbi:MAG: 50S ribosomal protein L21 [Verrucomicrobiae bacterium]|nr:50S ribosomal protein L21 [Verrucomicrobiae bacterium]